MPTPEVTPPATTDEAPEHEEASMTETFLAAFPKIEAPAADTGAGDAGDSGDDDDDSLLDDMIESIEEIPMLLFRPIRDLFRRDR